MRLGILFLLISLLVNTLPVWAAQPDAPGNLPQNTWNQPSSPPLNTGDNSLKQIVFSVAGQAVAVNNGGVLALHPDTPFSILDVETSGLLSFGTSARLAGLPDVNLQQSNSLQALLGQSIFEREYVDVQAMKGEALLGGVRIVVRFLAIDWLRRAEAARDYEQKVYGWYKAYQLSPDDNLLALNLLGGLRQLGRLQQALEVLDEYPGLNNDARALLQQGYVYQELGDNNKALAAWEAAHKLDGDNLEIMQALAAMYEAAGQHVKAASMLKRLLAKPAFMDDSALWLRLARGLSHNRADIKETLRAYERYGQLALMTPQLWLEVAAAKEAAAQNAMHEREQALKLAPDNREIIMQLQQAWRADKQPGKAAAVLEQGLKALPKDDGLWRELIALYWEMEDTAALIKAYQKYIKIRPEQTVLYYELALCLQKNGQIAEAADHMEKAWKLDQENYDYAYSLLLLEVELRKYDDALKLAALLTQKSPQNLNLWESLYSLLGKEKPKEFAAIIDNYLKNSAHPLPKIYEMRALLAINQSDRAGAAQILEDAVKLFPSDLRMAYLLGNIYEGLGQDAKALAAYEKVIDKNPGFADVSDRYLQLKTRLLQNK